MNSRSINIYNMTNFYYITWQGDATEPNGNQSIIYGWLLLSCQPASLIAAVYVIYNLILELDKKKSLCFINVLIMVAVQSVKESLWLVYYDVYSDR